MAYPSQEYFVQYNDALVSGTGIKWTHKTPDTMEGPKYKYVQLSKAEYDELKDKHGGNDDFDYRVEGATEGIKAKLVIFGANALTPSPGTA
jgi:hypothetical protein